MKTPQLPPPDGVRLPGDTPLPTLAAVRQDERPTPPIADAPFTLSAEVSQRKGHQTELFNAAPAGWQAIEGDDDTPHGEPIDFHD